MVNEIYNYAKLFSSFQPKDTLVLDPQVLALGNTYLRDMMGRHRAQWKMLTRPCAIVHTGTLPYGVMGDLARE